MAVQFPHEIEVNQMSAPDKYDEAYERWFKSPGPPSNLLKAAFLAGWNEGLRDAMAVNKRICPACGKPHRGSTEHCPECKIAMDAGDQPA